MIESIIGKTIENVVYNEDVDNEYIILYFTDGTEMTINTVAYDYGDKSAFLFS